MKRYFESTTFRKCVFPFIFFTFYALLCSLSPHELGRQDVPFVVMGHIIEREPSQIPSDHSSTDCVKTTTIEFSMLWKNDIIFVTCVSDEEMFFLIFLKF